MANTPKYRLKAKAAEKGRMLPYTKFDGTQAESARVTIAAVWENETGLAVRFEQPQHDALCKSFGLPAGSKVYFDLYAPEPAAPAPSTSTDDADVDF